MKYKVVDQRADLVKKVRNLYEEEEEKKSPTAIFRLRAANRELWSENEFLRIKYQEATLHLEQCGACKGKEFTHHWLHRAGKLIRKKTDRMMVDTDKITGLEW